MRKKTSLSASISFNLTFAIAIGLMSLYFNIDPVWGDKKESPGLPIARLSLPSITSDTTNVDAPTNTLIGRKVVQFRGIMHDLEGKIASIIQSTRDLYEKAILETDQYYFFKSEIQAKLQLGTTPSNPKLIELRNRALGQLDQIANTIGMMKSLSVGFSKSSLQMESLSSQIAAALHLPGALDEDHAHLILISAELEKVNRSITQSLEILNVNIERQSEWLENERIHFASFSSAIDKGKNPALSIKEGQPYLPIVDALRLNSRQKKLSHTPLSLKEKEKTESKSTNSHKKSSAEPLSPVSQLSQKITEGALSPKYEKESSLPLNLEQKKPTHLEPLPSSKEDAKPLLPLSPSSKIIHNIKPNSALKNEKFSSYQSAPFPVKTSQEQPLPLVDIPSHPKIQPLSEKERPSKPASSKDETSAISITYSSIAKGRVPLAAVDLKQDIQNQQWYLFASAKRASGALEIVAVGRGKELAQKADQVKKLLVEKGINPEQIRITTVKSEEDQPEQIDLFEEN